MVQLCLQCWHAFPPLPLCTAQLYTTRRGFVANKRLGSV